MVYKGKMTKQFKESTRVWPWFIFWHKHLNKRTCSIVNTKPMVLKYKHSTFVNYCDKWLDGKGILTLFSPNPNSRFFNITTFLPLLPFSGNLIFVCFLRKGFSTFPSSWSFSNFYYLQRRWQILLDRPVSPILYEVLFSKLTYGYLQTRLQNFKINPSPLFEKKTSVSGFLANYGLPSAPVRQRSSCSLFWMGE